MGDNNEIAIDVRVIAATHQDLPDLIRQGNFREDLFRLPLSIQGFIISRMAADINNPVVDCGSAQNVARIIPKINFWRL